jgi:hypothetical protein
MSAAGQNGGVQLAEERAEPSDLSDVDDKVDENDTEAKVEARQPTKARPRLNVVTLSDVLPEAVEWLWPGRLPFGKISIVEGDPGVGKSTLLLDVAARLSVGTPLPFEESVREPVDVLILTAEDGLADTVRPRLEAAGADLRRIHAIDSIETGKAGIKELPRLPSHTHLLAEQVEQLGARLLIVDPLTAFLSDDVNAWKDEDVRRALYPLSRLAEDSSAAVVVVRHLRKGGARRAILAGGGSIGIVGAARSALLVASDPDDEMKRVLAIVKCNLAKLTPSLSFELESTMQNLPKITWFGESSLSADELVQLGSDSEQGSALSDAVGFLQAALAAGPRPASEVYDEARQLGIADRTLRRARGELGVEFFRPDFGGPYYWRLPQ